ncbi:MAG TPA: hypothetical protein VK040_10020 [Balneolaceae bacterium]|nr:hypothetical protein [Balneolaceae bacterium]
MAILIADSGATSTDWLHADNGEVTRYKTQGLHPAYVNLQKDRLNVQASLGHLTPDTIWFYGTGCGLSESADNHIHALLKAIFPHAKIIIKSDLEGAGVAFFGEGSGIVAVLGTGAIAARCEAGILTHRSVSLGYAIGDEGSAADLGRRILKTWFRNTADTETLAWISEKLDDVRYGEMMNRIYNSKTPNRELASVAGRVLQGSFPKSLTGLIRASFADFIDQQLSALHPSDDERIVFTGAVAGAHKTLLIPLLKEAGFVHIDVKYPVIAAFEEQLRRSG